MCLRRIASVVFGSALCLLASLPAYPQNAASAKAFLNSIFRLYSNNGSGTPYSARYIHSSLLALIHADLKAAEKAQEVPVALDADIDCDCQEWDGIWVHRIDVKIVSPERAVVIASFDIYGPENRSVGDLRTMRYTLVSEHGNWRIYDVQDISSSTDSEVRVPLRKDIMKDLDYFKHESR